MFLSHHCSNMVSARYHKTDRFNDAIHLAMHKILLGVVYNTASGAKVRIFNVFGVINSKKCYLPALFFAFCLFWIAKCLP